MQALAALMVSADALLLAEQARLPKPRPFLYAWCSLQLAISFAVLWSPNRLNIPASPGWQVYWALQALVVLFRALRTFQAPPPP